MTDNEDQIEKSYCWYNLHLTVSPSTINIPPERLSDYESVVWPGRYWSARPCTVPALTGCVVVSPSLSLAEHGHASQLQRIRQIQEQILSIFYISSVSMKKKRETEDEKILEYPPSTYLYNQFSLILPWPVYLWRWQLRGILYRDKLGGKLSHPPWLED